MPNQAVEAGVFPASCHMHAIGYSSGGRDTQYLIVLLFQQYAESQLQMPFVFALQVVNTVEYKRSIGVLAKMAMFRRILAYGVFVLGAATQISATTLTTSTEKCATSMPLAAGFDVHVDGLTDSQSLTGLTVLNGVSFSGGTTLDDACKAVCVAANDAATGSTPVCHGYAIDTDKNSDTTGNCITYSGVKEVNLELQTDAEWVVTCEETAGTSSFYIIDRQDTCGVLTTNAEAYIGLHSITSIRATAVCTDPTSALHGSVPYDTPSSDAKCDKFDAREQKYHECVQREVNAANAKAGVTGTPMTLECGTLVFGSCYNEYSRDVPGDNCCSDVKVKMYPNALTSSEKTNIETVCNPAVTDKALSQEHLDKLKNEGLLCGVGVLSSPAGMLHTPSPLYTFAAGVFMTYLTSFVTGLA